MGNDAFGKLTRILEELESILQSLRLLAFKGTWHQSLLGKEADQTEERSTTPAKHPDPLRSPPQWAETSTTCEDLCAT